MKVLVVQPTVPHYRTAFLRGVAKQLHGDLLVHASPRIPGGPDSVPESELPGMHYNPHHKLRTWRGNLLYWQEGLALDGMSKGDVVFVAGNPRFLSLFPLLLKAKAQGIGIIIQGHGWSSSSRVLSARVRRALWRFGDVLFLYTDEERDQFLREGYAPERVFAANNTIGTEEIHRAIAQWPDRELAAFRHDHHLDDRPLLLFCGRLTPKAELHVLLNALAKLRTKRPVCLAIIGSGEEEQNLRRQAAALGLNATDVLWLGAIHDETRLAPWFLNAQLFVYPGAIGLSLLHAFNYGLPVVTHDQLRQHNPEIAALKPQYNGALFQRGDEHALIACLDALLESGEELTNMREHALQTVSQRFSTDMMVKRFVEAVNAAHRIALKLPLTEVERQA